jgi:hypothetical protein
MLSGKKLLKPTKTKFKQNVEENQLSKQKKKQNNKTAYRLLKQEKDDYEL